MKRSKPQDTAGEDDYEAVEPQSVDAEEIMFGALDAITKRFERTEGFSTMIEPELFNQCATVARLALEWARLETIRGDRKSKPNDYLRAAADLIQDSAKLIAVHPEREKKENDDRWKAKLEGRVSLDKIRGGRAGGVTVKMRDGSLFRFEPFTGDSDRGFREFVAKHWRRMIEADLSGNMKDESGQSRTLKDMLILSLAGGEKGMETAKQYLRSAGYKIRVEALDRAVQVAGNHSAIWAASVVQRWLEIVAEDATAERLAEWSKLGIEAIDLRSMAETRALGNKARGSGKRRAAKNAEGTSIKESEARKEQGKKRKKQPRG
jgi:hypothetical protein